MARLWYKDRSSVKELVSTLTLFGVKQFNHLVAHARMSGPYGNRGSNESREQTIANGSPKYFTQLLHLY